jgi:hypothetical protein
MGRYDLFNAIARNGGFRYFRRLYSNRQLDANGQLFLLADDDD